MLWDCTVKPTRTVDDIHKEWAKSEEATTLDIPWLWSKGCVTPDEMFWWTVASIAL